jgi:cyclic-di-GMP phosphodiesterase, flagellum assembly factor TipF
MVRISAIFIAGCMILIAASLGAVLFLRFGFGLANSALVAVGILTVLAVYNAVAGRRTDRAEVSNQVANIARGSGDLARQLAEFDRRLGAMEARVETSLDRALSATRPLAAEIEELSRLVNQLAENVAQHDAALGRPRSTDQAPSFTDFTMPLGGPGAAGKGSEVPASGTRNVAAFSGLERDAIVATVRSAIEGQRIDLHLQPIVTLPQRKVRYYEAMSRLNAGDGEIVAAEDFLPYAEAGALVPKLDNLSVLRCVQVVRRLLLKNREIGLFCNLAVATLADSGFPQLLEFLEANRAIAPSLVFEFTQSAVRAMGPIEHESLAALAERGFRFSMDNLTDLRVEPRELTERGFRFIKVHAALLLNRSGGTTTNIHPADFSDLLGRFGIDLIADRIESESIVVDLLDYDVRFGQGFLFSPPRPVRPEALVGAGETGRGDPGKGEPAKAAAPEAAPVATAAPSLPPAGGLARLLRSGN